MFRNLYQIANNFIFQINFYQRKFIFQLNKISIRKQNISADKKTKMSLIWHSSKQNFPNSIANNEYTNCNEKTNLTNANSYTNNENANCQQRNNSKFQIFYAKYIKCQRILNLWIDNAPKRSSSIASTANSNCNLLLLRNVRNSIANHKNWISIWKFL